MSRPRLSGVLPLVLAWLVSCTPAPSLPESSSGVMQLAVALPATAVPDDVTSVSVTISGPDLSPFTVQLAPTDGVWGGVLGDIPAGPGRTFLAQASGYTNTVLYEGRADDVTVTAGATGLVSLTLRALTPPKPVTNETPVVDSIVATPLIVAPGASVSIAVAAHDPNWEGSLRYAWSAPSGGFGSIDSPTTSWFAPITQGLVRLTVRIDDRSGAAVTTGLTVLVSAGQGAADVKVDFKPAFRVVSVASSRSLLDVGQKTALTTTTASAEGSVTYRWSATCAGRFSSTTIASPTFMPSARPSAACDNCRLSVTAKDGRGTQHQADISLCVSGDSVPRGPGTWTPTGALNFSRSAHKAALLPSGQVLVITGTSTANLRSTEVYNPATSTWRATGSLASPRNGPQVATLSSGQVLAAGGADSAGTPLATAEVYNPSTGVWNTTRAMGAARLIGEAVRLSNGKVLVSGGYDSTWNPTATATVYDPATSTWSPTGSMNVERSQHTLTLLADGRVLATGGNTASRRTALAEIYDPATGVWSLTGAMLLARSNHEATLLASGQVLVSGGGGDGPSTEMSAELYDPASGTWRFTGAMASGHDAHTATVLTSGKVLVAGGKSSNGVAAVAELYDPASGTWSRTGSLLAPRSEHTATRLPSGQVLIVGGTASGGPGDTAEVYEPLP